MRYSEYQLHRRLKMKAEELLQMLRDQQLQDDAIKALLEEAMKMLEPVEEAVDDEAKEKEEAGKLLGVTL